MIKIYTTPICPYCYTLKEFLKQHNLEFEEIDLSQDEKKREEIIKKTGQITTPIIEVEGKYAVGFDKEKLMEFLKIKE